MFLTWRNGCLSIGRDWWRGPDSYHIELTWNRIEDHTGVKPGSGFCQFYDTKEICWKINRHG